MLESSLHFWIAGAAFLLITLSGFLLVYAYRSRPEHFSWREYIVLIATPIALVAYFGLEHDPRVLLYFVAGAFTGTLFEYIVGLTYHRVMGVRLWTYHRFAVGGYTSLLSFPLWGVGAILFWLLARALGL